MIRQKIYSAYEDPELCSPFIDEFMERNGFEIKSVVHSSIQTDTYSHKRVVTVIYDDLDKPKVFDNDWDWRRRLSHGAISPMNPKSESVCLHDGWIETDCTDDGYCWSYCADCRARVKGEMMWEVNKATMLKHVKASGRFSEHEVRNLETMNFREIENVVVGLCGVHPVMLRASKKPITTG